MSAVFASRVARRRVIAYVVLVAATLLLMAVSANPLVIDLQRGIGFAFRPMQVAIDGFGRDLSSISAAIGEIDQLRLENEALRAENEQIQIEVRQAEELRRENLIRARAEAEDAEDDARERTSVAPLWLAPSLDFDLAAASRGLRFAEARHGGPGSSHRGALHNRGPPVV